MQRSIIHSLSPGTEVPRSIWSAAIYRRFLVKALAFTTLAVSVVLPQSRKLLPGRGQFMNCPYRH
ncbi:hypothetical protein THTE_0301 [Thermogutta terrifontis]|uniref:Uncharacterized protein n=1 Tax=Thermogutta terrifontis TaxID=1331910 RepID=A0A286RAD4_9BACT|nr:hypothetical protein THTE_0301 [Thermogutta terrifontis]